MNVLVLAEGPHDKHVLLPIVREMMKAVGKQWANVDWGQEAPFQGTGRALRWNWVEAALQDYGGMVDLFLLCVDRDGNEHRREVLDRLEDKAKRVLKGRQTLIAENAWQEVEVWLLMGHQFPPAWKWNWREIRAEVHPKERYYLPFARHRGVLNSPAEGRGFLAQEAAKNYGRIRQRCKEDVLNLENRIRRWLSGRREV
jgi:hypothetical protein